MRALHPAEVALYRAGKEEVFGFPMGQVMKRSHGWADPGLVNAAWRRALEG